MRVDPLKEARGKTPKRLLAYLILGVLLILPTVPSIFAQIVTEYQIKAVFLFKFPQFIEWPPFVFTGDSSPVVIGVLGKDPFGPYLDDTVRSEKVNNRPLIIERYQQVGDINNCHILFISRSEIDRLDSILAALKGRSILTVGDFDGFCKHGGMVRFLSENNKIRFKVNLEAVTAARIIISSKLLRSAQILAPGED